MRDLTLQGERADYDRDIAESAKLLSGGRCWSSPLLLKFEAFCSGGLVHGWSLQVQGQEDSAEDKFEINFVAESGDIAFHVKPRFSSSTVVANACQGGHWGPEEVSSVFPLALGEPFELEVHSDVAGFHVQAQALPVLWFPHRHWPLAEVTRVQVLSGNCLAGVQLSKGPSWG
ncbi:grifin [Echinops telfairi]|uniref:Galectin n=1 Tax=Echinops telfairi TaxID=9371 RepID=A0ABM1VN60_ECHTE|nr:grifin [Echinops telfairi]